MQQRTTTLLNQGLQLVHVAVLSLAISLILVPATRATPARSVFFVLAFCMCCINLHRLWRGGHLTKTPHQIYERALAGRRLSPTRLEAAAMGAALVAIFFVSPLHG